MKASHVWLMALAMAALWAATLAPLMPTTTTPTNDLQTRRNP